MSVKKRLKKWLSVLLTLGLVMGLLPMSPPMNAEAFGTSSTKFYNPAETGDTGLTGMALRTNYQRIEYAGHRWNVLDFDIDGHEELFLHLEHTMHLGRFYPHSMDPDNPGVVDPKANKYEFSSARSYILGDAFLNNFFTPTEQSAISKQDVLTGIGLEEQGVSTPDENGDPIFLLSHAEVTNSDYFPLGNSDRAVRAHTNMFWWLRNEGRYDSIAATVTPLGSPSWYSTSGGVTSGYVMMRVGVKLKLPSILFSSVAAAEGKPAAVGSGFSSLEQQMLDIIKLTILDEEQILDTAVVNIKEVVEGGQLTLNNYAYTNAPAERGYLSAILDDGEGNTYYSKLEHAAGTKTNGENLSIDVTGVPIGDYTLKLFTEQVNTELTPSGVQGIMGGMIGTDYASAMKEIPIRVLPLSPVSVTGVGLNTTSTSLEVGEEETLTAMIAPTSATNKNVTWSSSNTSIATVDSTGKVKAISEGNATITVKTVDGGFTASCAVEVTQPAPIIIPVIGVSLDKTAVNLTVEDVDVLLATVLPENASNQGVTWSSSDTSIATVDSTGKVTAINGGTATITVTTVDGNKTATCLVTVTVTVPVTGVSLGLGTTNLVVGETEELTAVVLPENASNQGVTWSSSNPSVATVDSTGKVTAVNGGIATITVRTADGNYTATRGVTVTVPVTGVSLNPTPTIIEVGAEETLTAMIAPANASNKNVSWSSSDTGIATIDSYGKVTAIAAGNATIMVVTLDGGFTATCEVEVKPAPPIVIPITGVALDRSAINLEAGTDESLIATVLPEDASNQEVTWTSSDTSIATVDSTGKVTSVNGGTAIITVTTVDGGFTAICTVTVTVPVTGVSLDKESTSLVVGAEELLTATITPSNATNKAITWSSDNTAIATVDSNGNVKAIGSGTATITARTADGNYTATCDVTVTVPVTGVSLNPTSMSLEIGEEEILAAIVVPASATNKEVSWTSDDMGVATVDSNGKVKAISEGTAEITVTTVDGDYTATCAVTVTPAPPIVIPVTSVALNKAETSIVVGSTEELTATVAPTDASNTDVNWSSNNESVATVDSNGKVTAINGGIAVIKVTTVDGGFTATCTVRVTVPVTGVSLNKGTTTMLVGAEETLVATVAPTNATNQNVTWYSSDESVATVDVNGNVKAIGAGAATITATTEDGSYTAACGVTVAVPVTGVSINPASTSIEVGAEETLTAVVIPEIADNKAVAWTSSNPAIATVDSNGKVKAISVGSATIAATTVDGGFEATCIVTVTPAPPIIVPVTSVAMNKTATTIVLGNTEELTATVAPADATDKGVNWSSNNENVATVDSNGVVTAMNGGTTVITATTVDGGFTATCIVTVTVPVAGVSINPATASIEVGMEATLTAIVAPASATNKAVTWTSDDTTVATVDSTGKVTAIGEGTAEITATTVDGGFEATCIVTVTLAPPIVIPVTSVSLNKTATNLLVGTDETLTAAVVPADATNPNVTWISDNPAVAIVDTNGKVTAIGGGTAEITVKTVDGEFTATCIVTVIVPTTGVSLNRGTTDLEVGAEETLIATVAPTNATNPNVTWVSSNSAIATVDTDGKVTAISEGTATITVTTEDGNKTATCIVTVSLPAVPVTGVSINPAEVSIEVGDEATLIATVAPIDATNQAVTWSSSDESVATVDNYGKVTAIGEGSAEITVRTDDGGLEATSEVTVTIPAPVVLPVASVSLDRTAVTITGGYTETLVATVLPVDATNKGVNWSSSDTSVATVDSDGIVTAIGVGSATITVTTVDGSHTATCQVMVPPSLVIVTGVELNKAATSLLVGEEETLTATVIPATALNKDVSWMSNDTSVATVNSNGKVTAIGVGTATITVRTDNAGKTDTCIVTVLAVPATGVELNKGTTSLEVGEEETLTATVTPATASNKAVTWSSNDTTVATVDNSGKVTATGAGTVTITATTADGGFTDTCIVTVSQPAVAVTGVEINKGATSLEVGEEETLTATITPADAANTNVIWISSNSAVVTVDSAGNIKAIGAGSATITVITEDGDYTDDCDVTVTVAIVPVTGVTLDEATLNMVEGDIETLTATIAPATASNKAVTWSSSDTSIATVDSNGNVEAISAGTATIIVTTADGNKTATCDVTVTAVPVPVTGVGLNKGTTSLLVGEDETLTATIAPATASNQAVTWTSSDTAVATVDSNGNVEAISAGTATITVTTVDGNHTDTCMVTVSVPATGVILNKVSTSLAVGVEESLVATVTPPSATNKNVIWSSDTLSVATVDSNGKVKAISVGIATITVTTVDGNYTANCLVTVTPPVPVTVPVASVSLNKGTTNLLVGTDETLIATVLPTDATTTDVTWSSDDNGVATVDSNGNVVAIGAGSATITVTTVDGGLTDNCVVTVTTAPKPVTSVSLNKGTTNLLVGVNETLTAMILPTDATNQNITWSSDNPAIATVDSTGNVTAIGAGTATITVETIDGGFTDTCLVTVTVPVTGVSLNKGAANLLVGANETLTATVAPTNATNQSITWSSNNPSVATVDSSGNVTAISEGSAMITVRTTDGNYTATCVVTVTSPAPITVPVTGVALDKGTIRMGTGTEETLTATVVPGNATNKTVAWTSSNTAVATVDSNGRVRSIGAGSATITVTTADGSYTATCGVTVTAPTTTPDTIPVTGVSLGRATVSLRVGAESTLKVTVEPATATNQNVTWTSSNTRVATVDRNGKVKALRAGTATITVTTVDGRSVQNLNAGMGSIATASGGFTATCRVTVTAATTSTRTSVTGVSLNKETTSLEAGKEEALIATVAPENANNKNVVWSSSDTKVATVNKNGKVKAVNEGTAVITVRTADGDYTATCEITVTKKAGSGSSSNPNASSRSNTAAGRTSTGATTTSTTGSAPATGDTVTILLPIIGLCSSVLCIAGLFIIRRKRSHREQ